MPVLRGQEAAPTPPAGPVRIAAGVIAGSLLEAKRPVYPAAAKAAGVSGAVILHAVIDKEGNIAKVTLISGPPLLQDAAVDAVQQWKYRPYLLNGEPTEVDTTITVNFNLNKNLLRVSTAVMDERKISGDTPPLPAGYDVAGTVVLIVTIDAKGEVTSARAIQGPQLLRAIAEDGVKSWRYKPYTLNDESLPVETTVMMNFRW